MATFEFKLPDLGEGVVEGEIVKWLVEEGDTLTEDQGVVEVMTDKATVTVPSSVKGKVVKRIGNEGDMAQVHGVLLIVEGEAGAGAEASAAAPAAPAPEAPASKPSAPAARADTKVLATPLTRRIASEHGLDLTAIPGTGAQGRVTKADVLAVVEGGAARQAQSAPVVQLPAPLRPVAGDERVPLRGLRKKIAEKMVRSKQLIPHFAFVEELDCTELVALRKRLNTQLAAQGQDVKLSYLPFIIKAVVAALKRFPDLNANFDEANQELVVRGEYNIGMAVSTDDGLTVAVIKNADRLSLKELASEVLRLSTAARERKLTMDELTGGTFTISSLGQTGGIFATPIINHPEVGILGVHRMRKRAVVVDDEIVARETMNISISADHRVIDGHVAADFVYTVLGYLAHPDTLFLEMA
ncbi:MAG TPA: dihydrolipoamide acetyltransferase family protein [Myxococcaceae bacterium]|nr:dihydrolipoamide acetyltransferase family protein [Myxococcaceae bacterium]